MVIEMIEKKKPGTVEKNKTKKKNIDINSIVWKKNLWKGGYFHIFRDFNNWTLRLWRNVALTSF